MKKPNPIPFQVAIAAVLLIAASMVLAACDRVTASTGVPVDAIAMPSTAVYFGIDYGSVQSTFAQDFAEQPQAF